MSTDVGGKAVAEAMLLDAKVGVEGRRKAAGVQFDFLEAPSPEAMARAQAALGESASRLDVLDEARRNGGRKRGSRNRRTEDFGKYLLSFGQHPAVTLMKIQATPPEILVERSAAMDTSKRRMSYNDAQQLITRCADILLPFIESKKPVAIDLGVNGDFNLLIPGLNISAPDAQSAADGTFLLEADYVDVDVEDGEDGNGA